MKELLSHLSARARRLYDSDIQDMIELVHQNQALSFTAGEPSEDLLPLEKLRSSFAAAFDGGPEMLTYYHDSDGHEELRRWIASWMRKDGLIPSCLDWRQLMLTTGSHEGINITVEGLVDPGDAVAVEAPSYAEALLTFSKEGAVFFGLDMDSQGPLPKKLEILARGHHIKLLYTIPNYQNPSGTVTSPERRKEILDLAKKYDFLILEDDPYRHLYYDAPPPGSYLALPENDGRVIYLGSFSKLIAPGIRCGWMIASPELYEKFHQLRVTNDLNRRRCRAATAAGRFSGSPDHASQNLRRKAERHGKGSAETYRSGGFYLRSSQRRVFPLGESSLAAALPGVRQVCGNRREDRHHSRRDFFHLPGELPGYPAALLRQGLPGKGRGRMCPTGPGHEEI